MWKNRIVGYTEEAPDQLLAHYANPRTHDGKQRDAMRASLDELGIIAPCTVNDRSGNMIDGHMRCEEYITAGITKVPVNHLDLSEQEELKAIAFFDRIGALAGTNQENLEYLLENIELDNTPLENLLEDIREKKTVLPEDIDDIPEVETPISKLGDLWLLDGHRVLCGDSTDQASVERLMDGKKADMVFTDPPYGVEYQSNQRTKTPKFAVIQNDNQLLSGWIPIVHDHSTGFIFVWTSWKVYPQWENLLSKQYGEPTNVIIWNKAGGGMGDLKKTFATDFEMAIVYNRETEITGKRIGSVWNIGKDFAGNYQHPTQKPVALAAQAIQSCTTPKQTVLDVFLGSGSTLIACEQTNRTCYGLELDPHYVNVICKRWQTLTGQLPILEASGEAYDFIGE